MKTKFKTLWKKSKTALGTAFVIAGSMFLASLILELVPQNINIWLSFIIGIIITLIGGYLLATK